MKNAQLFSKEIPKYFLCLPSEIEVKGYIRIRLRAAWIDDNVADWLQKPEAKNN